MKLIEARLTLTSLCNTSLLLGETFTYYFVGKEKTEQLSTDLYSFKCLFNHPYIIEVESHSHNIYIVKFFQKNHRNSKHRYSLLNTKAARKNTSGAKNFLLILNTVIKVILDTYIKDRSASFGFLGAPTKTEMNPKKNKERINADGTVAETKRYNTYSIYVKRYFSPEQFEHVELKTSSGYLIRSKKNPNLTKQKIENFFVKYIEDHC